MRKQLTQKHPIERVSIEDKEKFLEVSSENSLPSSEEQDEIYIILLNNKISRL